MTTLPQTTPTRMPRPAGGAMAPVPQTAHPMSVPPPPSGMTRSDVIRVLRNNLWLVAVMLVVSGVGGYFANRYLAANYPQYTANAFVQVNLLQLYDPLNRQMSQNMDLGPNMMTNEVRTQAALLKSEALFSRVLQNNFSPLRETRWYKDFPSFAEAKRDLQEKFRVNPSGDTRLLSVSMTGKHREDLKVIISEIVETHIRQQKDAAERRSTEQTQVLNQLQDRYQRILSRLRNEIAFKQRELNEQGMAAQANRMGFAEYELQALVADLGRARENAQSARSFYEGIRARLESGEPLPQVEEQINRDLEVRSLISQVRGIAVEREVIQAVIPPHMLDKNTKRHINPTGSFVIGGPMGDAGLTGRKIIVDTYGGYSRHGGGAFSGKDPSKVDRSACYMARYIAKNIVAAGLATKAEVQLAYAIGVAEPVGVMVDTFGTGVIAEERISEIVRAVFPLTPRGIIETLNLRRPIYRATAAYGHFGRNEEGFTWERADKAGALRKEAGLGAEAKQEVAAR